MTKDIFSGKIFSKIDLLYDGVNDRAKYENALTALNEIQDILQSFKIEIDKRELEKELSLQIASQYKNAAAQFIHIEKYFYDIKNGHKPEIDDDLARKYVSNLHLILNGFLDIANEVDRGHSKMD